MNEAWAFGVLSDVGRPVSRSEDSFGPCLEQLLGGLRVMFKVDIKRVDIIHLFRLRVIGKLLAHFLSCGLMEAALAPVHYVDSSKWYSRMANELLPQGGECVLGAWVVAAFYGAGCASPYAQLCWQYAQSWILG